MENTFAMTPRQSGANLRTLARACGIQTSYRDMSGRFKTASPEALIATLKAFGIEISSASDAPEAMTRLINERRRQVVEPVIIAWEGHFKHLDVRLPCLPGMNVEAALTLETGEKRQFTWSDISTYFQSETVDDKTKYRPIRLPLGQRLPWGYHQLNISAGGIDASCMVIAAPRRVPSLSGTRRWGLFCPLYALRSKKNWGAGDISDFLHLAGWSASLGAGILATLPLLPAFLKEHLNPSPYSPVSRLFWNEFYISLESVPELAACPEAATLLNSIEFAAESNRLRATPLVDYRRQMMLKRKVLELLAESFFSHPAPDRHMAYDEYLASRPEVKEYARFRAVSEERQTPWREWPERLRDGLIEDGDCRPELSRYYLYNQFIIDEQMAAAATELRRNGQTWYLDLPLGSHPDGYDAWWEQKIFASGSSVGAPPDPVFRSGQDWGFPPLHPVKLRQSGYRYVIQMLRHHLRCAGVLRLDHIMGLHRLFWIPSGVAAGEAVYVRYEPEEMYAILCLEAQRHQAAIVGEDLGLVPAEVRRSMRRHGILRSYIAQYEMITENEHCLDTVPGDAVAALNTHDMHPFAAFWQSADITERQALGVLRAEQADAETVLRRAGKTSLVQCLRRRGLLNPGEPSTRQVYQSVCRLLAGSDARELLLNIDDLTGGTLAQNIPGTVAEHPNWQRRSAKSLEELEADPEINVFLKEIDRRRKQGCN